MRIYRVDIEHRQHGRNFTSFRVLAKSFDAAVKKVTKKLEDGELIEAIVIIADTSD